VLGVAVHPDAVFPRLLLQLGPGGREGFVGDPAEQEGVGRGQLVELELVAFLPAVELKRPCSALEPFRAAGSSITPSSETNSDTTTFLTSILLQDAETPVVEAELAYRDLNHKAH
jgi:hypothetical protein